MKKIAIALVAIATLVAVGCSGIGPTGGTTEIVGTWTNISREYIEMDLTPAASGLEGTWASTTIDYPTVPVVSDPAGAVTSHTEYDDDDTTTVTTTKNLVINASGSYVKTTTTATVWTARTAYPLDTATVTSTNNGTLNAIVAGSLTETETITSTVSVVGNYYKETIVTTTTNVYTGNQKTVAATAYVAADNTTSTSTVVNEVTASGSLSYNVGALIAGLTHTVLGTTVGAPANLGSTNTRTITIAFAKDGTYTSTTVDLYDLPAQPAVAATANSPAVIASAAGTQTTTTVVTGDYTSAKVYYGAAVTSGYYEEKQDLFLYELTKTVSQIGTGSLIDKYYPLTAKTTFDDEIRTITYQLLVNKDAVILYSWVSGQPAGETSSGALIPATNGYWAPTVYTLVAEE